jgi:hypothetical protein
MKIAMRFVVVFCLIFSSQLHAQEASITVWKDSVIGALYNKATLSVSYGKKDANGVYKIYLSDTLGQNEKLLTYKGWSPDRHQWAEEWHPSGEYLFCIVEKETYDKTEKEHKRSSIDATPGYGAYSDLWLLKRDGTQAWQLTNLPSRWSSAIIHCAISDDGTLFGWSERVRSPKYSDKNLAAGAYVLKVADFVFDSVPRFENIRTFQPGGVDAANEMESFSKDKKWVSFYSTFESKHLFRTPCYLLNMETGEIKKLTEHSFAQAPAFTPDGLRIVYMTGHECDIFPFQLQGADWWIMNADGTDKKRISFMNVKNHLHSVNKFRLAGSLSFISNNSFLGGIMTKSLGLTGYTAKVVFYE